MVGAIYSSQKCPVCGETYKDNHRDGLDCPDHPEQRATKFSVRFGKGIHRRFDSYRLARRFLTGLRFKVDEGSFDARDYRRENPLGFKNLVEKWLEIKERELKTKSYRNLHNTMKRATKAWGDRNVKDIRYGDIEDFLMSQKKEKIASPVSDKTRANMKSVLHSFWTWLRKRREVELHQIPEFPEVSFELGFRNTIDKSTQDAILAEIHRMSCDVDPKIWIGIRFLCTYVSIRPGELLGLLEKHIDLENGYLFFPHPKEKKPKPVPILEEDAELLRKIPGGFPDQPFFRHPKGIKGCVAGSPYGYRYFYKWWKRACCKLGVENVDLYGGTRHSTVKALRKYHSPEEIKRATMHSTNKAFERYFQMEADDVRDIYRNTRNKAPKVDRLEKLVKFKR